MSEITRGEELVPPVFRRIEEGNAVLVVREVWAEAARRILAPLHQAWARIAQRLASSGRAHGAWWRATNAKRNLRGDGLGTLASASKLAGPRSRATHR